MTDDQAKRAAIMSAEMDLVYAAIHKDGPGIVEASARYRRAVSMWGTESEKSVLASLKGYQP